MVFANFLGADYRSQSVKTDAEQTINWYLEQTGSPTGQQPFPVALYPTPGLTTWVANLDGPVRGLLMQDGRCFAVAGSKFYECDGTGTATEHGDVALDTLPASIVSNGHGGHQVLIVTGGRGYIFDLNTNKLTEIASSGFPSNAVMADFLDGYFIVLQASTSSFYLSALFNGLEWNAGVGQVSSSSDNLSAIRVIQRNLWLFGSQRSEVWVNSGGSFPFEPIAGALIEYGIAAPWSLAEADGTLLLVGTDERGTAMVLQNRGYGFARISTSSEERTLSAVPNLSDTRGFTYQEEGHTFYVLVPSVGESLVYDLATRLWHRRGVWNSATGQFDPLVQTCHASGWGRHLVGSRVDGTIYTQHLAATTDDGVPIRRVRQCPHLNIEQQWHFYHQMQIDLESGLGNTVEPGQTPQLLLGWSDDGGHTFTGTQTVSAGAIGAYRARAIWHRLGRSRDRVFQVSVTDPIPWRIQGAYLRLSAGTGQS